MITFVILLAFTVYAIFIFLVNEVNFFKSRRGLVELMESFIESVILLLFVYLFFGDSWGLFTENFEMVKNYTEVFLLLTIFALGTVVFRFIRRLFLNRDLNPSES